MIPLRIAFLAATLALGACMAPETASRNAADPAALPAVTAQGATAPQWNVKKVSVEVPRSLHVSEANMYIPIADIVWRGEPRGDRHAQVDAIVTKSAELATKGMHQGTPVTVEITMKRFHALSEIARYSFGGTYGMNFDLTIRDAKTGAVIDGPRHVKAGFHASGGQKALEEEARGLTEKVVITRDLEGLIRSELQKPLRGSAVPRLSQAD